MSFPFESRSHAYLRRRLLAAMGLFPGCASEASFVDGGRDGDDASAVQPQDASSSNPLHDASTISCQAGGLQTECLSRLVMEDLLRWGAGQIRPSEPLRTEAQIQALFLPNGCLPRQYAHNSCCNPAASEATVNADGTCCYAFCESSCCGRPFVVEGKARMARAQRRGDWLSVLPALGGKSLPMPLRERAAAEWLEDARMEHASVAAFARFTLELLAFGAPADLVTESQLAGLDEIEHARLCFALASRYAGADLGPGALSMSNVLPAASLRESVLSALLEGCIGEALAAARANAALEGVRDQAARTVLGKIAEDEARHAELAYRYVAWALTREPSLAEDIRELVRRESGLLSQKEHELDGPLDVLEPALTLLGRLSARRSRQCHDAAFAQVILPCIHSLLAAHAEAMEEGSTRGQRNQDVV